ncbi:isoprenyl transferase [Mesorhizobium sp. SB112]|uniref:isoprenyl transferase n=1 Tax=Mesorhizobium sp. SB112 TaxID=3151853 RepID=UPI003263D03A
MTETPEATENRTMTNPAHVAIIMDGNGRWAKERGLPRVAGHRSGVEALRRIVRAVGQKGIPWLTVYAFSSENWTRPQSEVSDLMGLLKIFIHKDLNELHGNGVRVRIVGEREGLQPEIRKLLEAAEEKTAENRNMTLVIAFNYGGRDEILRAAKRMARAAMDGDLQLESVTAETFGGFLDTAGIPDPELVIRTSGEMRLSNFLLWQAAYSELVFMPCYWPDFTSDHLNQALDQFSRRERRFGGRTEQEFAS